MQDFQIVVAIIVYSVMVVLPVWLALPQQLEPLLPHRVQLVLLACIQLEWLRLFVSQLRFCVSWCLLVKDVDGASVESVSAVDGGDADAVYGSTKIHSASGPSKSICCTGAHGCHYPNSACNICQNLVAIVQSSREGAICYWHSGTKIYHT